MLQIGCHPGCAKLEISRRIVKLAAGGHSMRSMTLSAAILLLSLGIARAQDQTPAAAPPPADAAGLPADTNAPAMIPLNVPSNPPMTGPQLLIQTSMGDITLQLDAVRAPLSVANVLRYAREKHYDGTVFYRVVKGFIIQMGSWDANVKGRPVHKPIALEANNGLSNLRGTVALGRENEPTSATADFFINVVDDTGLDHHKDDPGNTTGYAVFGQVISGMDVVERISEVPVGDHGPMKGAAPVDPVTVKKVTVIGDAAPKAITAKKKK
jgi:peptidyl-prolyl cis-trans isomerase A (cyclophilin A)